MYLIYKTKKSGLATEFTKVEKRYKVCLFGRNEGWIPWILKQSLIGSKANSEPLYWHLSEALITEELEKDQEKPNGNALLIDLKPHDKKNLSLYQVLEAWGHSASGWSPVMLRLRALFVDADPTKFDRTRFTRSDCETTGPIFSLYYARGTVDGGNLKGTWNLPRPSSTNSVVLWPDTMRYFSNAARRVLRAS
jgi:hypothetical protein